MQVRQARYLFVAKVLTLIIPCVMESASFDNPPVALDKSTNHVITPRRSGMMLSSSTESASCMHAIGGWRLVAGHASSAS